MNESEHSKEIQERIKKGNEACERFLAEYTSPLIKHVTGLLEKHKENK